MIGRYKTSTLLTEAEERLVRALLSNITSNEELAAELGVTQSTVKSHISHILRKIGRKNRTSIVLWAAKNGYWEGKI